MRAILTKFPVNARLPESRQQNGYVSVSCRPTSTYFVPITVIMKEP